MESRSAQIWRLATTSGVPKRSFWVAAIVGTIINLINQGDVLVMGGSVNWLKVGLTYCVPYLVATYGAVTARMAMEAR